MMKEAQTKMAAMLICLAYGEIAPALAYAMDREPSVYEIEWSIRAIEKVWDGA